ETVTPRFSRHVGLDQKSVTCVSGGRAGLLIVLISDRTNGCGMNTPSKQTRRRFLLGAGTFAAGLEFSSAGTALAQEMAPTPACHDGDEATLRQSEGPFFKPSSPERSDLREPGAPGRNFELSGFVLTKRCRVLGGAVVDIWHADDKGEYDDAG